MCHARGFAAATVAAACVRGGVTLLQVRDKAGPTAVFLDRTDRILVLARAAGARVIVNDRADLAAMSGADGVHVGQEDLDVDDARRIVGPDTIVGLSTHTKEQVDRALESTASYVAVGPVYGTVTKFTGYGARGLDLVTYAAGRGKPIVGIGGITLERATDVIAAGASAVAVITDLLVGDSVESRVRAFVDALPPLPFKV